MENINNLSLEEISELIEKTKKQIAILKYNILEKCENINQILDDLECNNLRKTLYKESI